MPIPFTQYMRPDGRKRHVEIERPAVIEEKANGIIKFGYHFECEELHDGHVSFTIGNANGDYFFQMCMNGPEVPETVDRLVESFDLTVAKRMEQNV